MVHFLPIGWLYICIYIYISPIPPIKGTRKLHWCLQGAPELHNYNWVFRGPTFQHFLVLGVRFFQMKLGLLKISGTEMIYQPMAKLDLYINENTKVLKIQIIFRVVDFGPESKTNPGNKYLDPYRYHLWLCFRKCRGRNPTIWWVNTVDLKCLFVRLIKPQKIRQGDATDPREGSVFRSCKSDIGINLR